MADSSLLAAALTGQDPLSAEMLDALHQEQAHNIAANPANFQNQGIYGGIASILAGIIAPNAHNTVADIAQQRAAARPEMAKLLTAPDPYAAAANNPNVNPLNLAQLLSGATPESVADARLKAAQAEFARARIPAIMSLSTPITPGSMPGNAPATGGAVPTAAPAAAGGNGGPLPAGGGNWETTHNNFAGMRIPGSTVGPNAGGFQAFATPADGIAAISHQLDRYASGATTGKPINTLAEVVSTWAPPSENDTGALLARASKITGFDPNQPLNIADPAVKARLIRALIMNEQGGRMPQEVTPELISQVVGNPNAQALAVGGALPGALAASPAPINPGIAQLAALGHPAAPPTAPAQPGAVPGVPAWQIAEAQRRAQLFPMLGLSTPQFLNEEAGLPFVGPKAAATAEAENAAKLRYAYPQSYATAEGQAQAAWDKPAVTRNGVINPRTGQLVGAVPTLQKVASPDGSEHYVYVTPPTAANPNPTMAPVGGQATIGPGQEEALKTRANEEQKQRQEVIDDANVAQQQRATLMNMANEAGNFLQGPFADHVQLADRYLRLINPSYNGQVASYEDFIKNAGSLTRQAVKETSGRAAVQEFTMIQDTLPNPDMSPQGLQRVQNELIGLSDYKIAKAQAQQAWEQQHGGIGNVSGFETAFQKAASPYAFIVARMAPEDRQQMIAKLQGSAEGRQELGALKQQLQFMKNAGLAQ